MASLSRLIQELSHHVEDQLQKERTGQLPIERMVADLQSLDQPVSREDDVVRVQWREWLNELRISLRPFQYLVQRTAANQASFSSSGEQTLPVHSRDPPRFQFTLQQAKGVYQLLKNSLPNLPPLDVEAVQGWILLANLSTALRRFMDHHPWLIFILNMLPVKEDDEEVKEAAAQRAEAEEEKHPPPDALAQSLGQALNVLHLQGDLDVGGLSVDDIANMADRLSFELPPLPSELRARLRARQDEIRKGEASDSEDSLPDLVDENDEPVNIS